MKWVLLVFVHGVAVLARQSFTPLATKVHALISYEHRDGMQQSDHVSDGFGLPTRIKLIWRRSVGPERVSGMLFSAEVNLTDDVFDWAKTVKMAATDRNSTHLQLVDSRLQMTAELLSEGWEHQRNSTELPLWAEICAFGLRVEAVARSRRIVKFALT